MNESFYKDWEASPSLNNDGNVPFYRPLKLTPAEKEQACKNIGVASNDAIERLEDEFTDLRGDMATVSSDVASAVANANSALASASAATTAAQAAIDSITGYATDLATVSSKADTNSGNIGTLSSDVSTLSANVGAISGKNTSQDTKIGELSSSVAGLTNSAVYHEAVINNLTTAWSAYSADLKNDFDTFSAAEDTVITAATAAIPGQVSAEVSGQLSGKQDKLTSANAGINISISTAGVIDVKNEGGTTNNRSIAFGYNCSALGRWSFAHGYQSIASAENSYGHAEGAYTSAMNNNSHTEGLSTISDTNNQHVEGQYNAPATGALHVIGNGTSTAQRSNIVETYSDRVVVNGDLINDTKDQVLAQFMFDQMPATQTEGKLITQKLLPSGQYVINEYVVGNYEISKVGGFTGSQSPGCTTPGGAILAWDGNVGQAMRGQYSTNWTPTAWPTDKLPRNVYASAQNLSWNNFAAYNMSLKELPSGWYNSLTAYCDEASASLYHVAQMFKGCRNLSGDVKPWMDFVLTQSGAGQAGNPSREFYRRGMFALCSAVDNYATLSANPTYSAFFDPS